MSLWARLIGSGISSGVSLQAKPSMIPWSPAPCVLADGVVDLRRLLFHGDDDAAALAVEPYSGPVVADVGDDGAGDSRAVDVVLGGDLAHDQDEAGRRDDLAGAVGVRVVGDDVVQDGVGDLVADLVGVALGHAFAGDEKRGAAHECHGHVWSSLDFESDIWVLDMFISECY